MRLLLLVLAALPAAAAAQRATLDALMSAPFPYALVAGRSTIAWVQNDQGVRNIWVAEAPSYQARQATRYSADDGQDLGALSLSPDGKTLVFVRGGAANRAGEIPNPASSPAGAEQAIWKLDLVTGAAARVGPGSGPAISPRGDGFAFLRGGDVWWAPLAGGEPSVLVRARGAEGSLRWAPDGSRLAFVSNRGDHSFIGIYDQAAKTLTWISPTVDSDRDPVWSPDGARIAFMRVPAAAPLVPPMFRPVREAQPWSIRVADARTGESREAWRADAGRGSAYWPIVSESQLHWLGDRIVFAWEKNGWVQLYSIAASGGPPIHLTPGAFEVEYVTAHPNGRELVFNSNQDDIDRRHLWRVAATGGPPVRLTSGRGIEWSPVVTADGTIAFHASDARTPAHTRVLLNNEPRSLQPVPATFPSAALVEPTAVTLTAADGKPVPAQLFLPPDARPGDRRPAVVYLHGGSRRQMLLGFNYSPYYHNAYSLNQYLASKGYVVLSLNYRSGIGYGMEFREALNYGATGGSEFLDVLGAGLYLRSRPEVDASRIGLWGGSYGGYLTAMGLARASDLFAAGVDIHGVHDWNVGIRTFIPNYSVLEQPEAARVAFNASPMASLDSWRSPVLLIHGDDDRNVSFAETVTLVEALRRRGVEVEQLVLPDEVHSFLRHANWLAAYRATADFLERKLAPRRTTNGR